MSEIATSYLDVWQREHKIDPDVQRALEVALGPRRPPRPLPRTPAVRCYEPPVLARGWRLWGFALQLYGLQSARNWGMGDFADLRVALDIGARLGAAVVGVNPLHASDASPYSPSSRHALNPLYIAPEEVPEYREIGTAGPPPRASTGCLLDYAEVARVKRAVFEQLYDAFGRNSPRRREFERFREQAPTALRDYALYEALREKLGGNSWREWPPEYRDPTSPAVGAFARKYRREIEFHEYLQWNARLQLDAVQRHAHHLGMPIGLYVDLALGAQLGGAEVWAHQGDYATSVTIGAPPDEFNPRGQDWGLPPYSPRALRAQGLRPFRDLLRANMPKGGAIRLDHVMALTRLYWIPSGNKPDAGGYVNYPFEDMLNVIAAESRRARCMVIGEDLGTVSSAFRRALNTAGVLSYHPLIFEKHADGSFAQPHEYPRDALVCVSTHDLPTWKGYWSERDLDLREKLGLMVDARAERKRRHADKRALAAALRAAGLDLSADSAHRFLGRTPSKVLMVQPEDVLGLEEQANLPGTVDEHPNWRRRLPLPLEAWVDDERFQILSRVLAERSFNEAPR